MSIAAVILAAGLSVFFYLLIKGRRNYYGAESVYVDGKKTALSKMARRICRKLKIPRKYVFALSHRVHLAAAELKSEAGKARAPSHQVLVAFFLAGCLRGFAEQASSPEEAVRLREYAGSAEKYAREL
jgi:hypothetical protein